jgi:hypothetical protein
MIPVTFLIGNYEIGNYEINHFVPSCLIVTRCESARSSWGIPVLGNRYCAVFQFKMKKLMC